MKQPLITVGLTTYNASFTLNKALQSIINQSWRPIEIVAVDDASVDNTIELLNEYSKYNKELRVFANDKNHGVAFTRNKILDEARGEFVAFFDDDDVSLPDRLSQQYFRIIDYERDFALGAPVICHTARKVIYPNGKSILQSTIGENKNLIAPSGSSFLKRNLAGLALKNGHGSCATCSQMARLSTYRLVGGFDINFRRQEDSDFNIRLAENGGHFIGISEPLVIQNMTKTSEKSLDEELKMNMYFVNKYRYLIERYVNYNFIIEYYNLRNSWFKGEWKIFLKRLLILTFKYPTLTSLRLILALKNYNIHKAFKNFHK
jgi:glycosyltransferase involved in cell wall biosynthesis